MTAPEKRIVRQLLNPGRVPFMHMNPTEQLCVLAAAYTNEGDEFVLEECVDTDANTWKSFDPATFDTENIYRVKSCVNMYSNQYMVVEHLTVNELVEEVSALISDGWNVAGGIAVSTTSTGMLIWARQAMVKYSQS